MPDWTQVATLLTTITGAVVAIAAVFARRRTAQTDAEQGRIALSIDGERLELEQHRTIVDHYHKLYEAVTTRLAGVERQLVDTEKRERECEANLAEERRARETLEARVAVLDRRLSEGT